ncbi:MAG: DUF11 domain-containing protein [Clostridia bacterium]|nr:DUF11 domain-containing protein [Clostridia bacterium]
MALASIFTLTFSDFAFVGKAYGTSLSTLFGNGASHENVVFDAYFQDDKTIGKDFESNVNNDSLNMKFLLNVEKAGYLKDAQIEILPIDGQKLNFEIENNVIDSGIEEIIPQEEEKNVEIEVPNEPEKPQEIVENIPSITTEDEIKDEKKEIVEEDEIQTENTNSLNLLEDKQIDVQDDNTSNTTNVDSLTLDMNENTVSENSIDDNTQKIELTMGNENTFNSSESINLSVEGQDIKTQDKLFNEEQITKFVETIDENIIKLKQIRATSNVEIDVPVKYRNEKYTTEDMFTNYAIVKLVGVYVDKNGEEKPIEYTHQLNLSWKDERFIKLGSKVIKYIDYGNGIILQTRVGLSNEVEGNTLPVKETNIQVKVPTIMGKNPSNVNVTAGNLYATNGETTGNNSFSKDNWKYFSEENLISINVENKGIEKNYYDEEKAGLKQQELSTRIYNGSGEDEFIITYIYKGVTSEGSSFTLQNDVEARMKLYSGILSDNFENIITDEYKDEVILEKTTGEIASLEVENMTESISKAYFYANFRQLDTYDLNITAKYVMNVANKELVDNLFFEDVQNFYIDKSGNSIPNNDLSYKEIVVNRANFEDILGLDGEIKIYDANNKAVEYGKFNKDTVVDTNGDMSLFVQGKIDRIRFEVSKPINEGNLVVKTTKGLGNLSISKEEFQNIGEILTRTDFNVKYSDIEEELNLGTKNTITELKDTMTKANLVIEKPLLSTLSLNENVDIKIELNNDKAESDLYGHSVFEIEYPSYVDDITILNTSLLYGEGLDVAYVNNQDRKITVVTDGIQKELNSGILTNGTNIVISTNIKVNVFTPSVIEAFKMTYVNDEATNYYENGSAEAYVKYSSPSGLVAVNTIRNYKDNSSFITSVRQGSHGDLLNLYQEEKRASMEILAMNNTNEDIKNLNILGRFPYIGMKDILTDEDMGNTRDINVLNIVPDVNNNGEFTIYYSDVEDATNDLLDNKNRWVENINSITNPKSYLIVPNSSEYTLRKADVVKFTYEFVIPSDMGHGEKIVGTFVASYDDKDGSIIPKSYPDIVYLDTESGPELEIEVDADNEAYENSEMYATVQVRNKGSFAAKNIIIRIPNPNNTTYVTHYSDPDKKLTVTETGNEIVVNAVALNKGENIVFDVIYRIDGLKDFEESNKEHEIMINASIEAADLGSVIKASPKTIKVNESEVLVRESLIDDSKDMAYREGNEIPINIVVSNLSNHNIDGIILEKQIPEGLQLVEITRFIDGEYKEVQGNMFDERLNIEVGTIETGKSEVFKCTYKVEDLDKSTLKGIIKSKSIVRINNREYESNELSINIARANLELIQETDSQNTYIKENDLVNYTIKIRNTGSVEATGLSFEDEIPSGLSIVSYSYEMNGIRREEVGVTTGKIFEYIHIDPNEEVVFKITAKAQSDIDSLEKSVTNVAKVNSYEQGVVSSNSITHIIEKMEPIQEKIEPIEVSQMENTEEHTVESNMLENVDVGNQIEMPKLVETISGKENIERTFKISGYIWEDNNKDGIRGNNEGKIDDYKDMSVRLINAETGVIEGETSPDDMGYYVFQGVKNGNHYVALNYNTRKYGITTYKKDGASEIVNSDIIASKVEEDGKLIKTAITDKICISNKSISNVDMGLFYAEKFDLEIDSTITQVMIQTSRGMETTNFDHQKLAKVEIAPNYIDESTAYVEYTIKVSNNGDVPGYAKKIVSYLSNDMEFNSSLEANIKWFSGADGNIYTNELANVELKPGESKEIKLVLQKKMTEENTGLVNNQVEIAEDYNIYGISDFDSISGNYIQAEDDMSLADAIITVETGEKVIYTIVAVLLLAAITTGGYASYIKLWPKIEPKINKTSRKNKKSKKKEE